MKGRAFMLALFAGFGGAVDAVSADSVAVAGGDFAIVIDAARAEFNWKLNCQGCHGVNAQGSANGAPPMPGVIGGFLHVGGGREYLVQVPGVAHAPLNDEELADVLNWMLVRFACEPLLAGFKGYGSAEVGALRRDVLITRAHEVRSELISKISKSGQGMPLNIEPTREAMPCLNQSE